MLRSDVGPILDLRPVSANPHDFGNWSTNGTILDLIGLDYPCTHGPCYDRVHAIAPTHPMIGSEMGSTTSDRGVYAGSRNVSHVLYPCNE